MSVFVCPGPAFWAGFRGQRPGGAALPAFWADFAGSGRAAAALPAFWVNPYRFSDVTERAWHHGRMSPSEPSSTPASFTLRFRDARTRQLLRLVAKRRGQSMNHVAEELLARELALAAGDLEQELEHALGLLRDLRSRGSHDEADVAAFARAEVAHDDPLQARMVPTGPRSDPFDAVVALADTLE